MPFGKRKQGNKFQVINTETGDVKGTHATEADADKQLAALHANNADKDKADMSKIVTKAMAAELIPVDDGSDPVGSFHAIISSEKRDRDGDQLWANEWETPLPEHIQIIGDHDNHHIMSTIGSGPPTLESDNKIHVRGNYATTSYAQDARKLVNGKHLRHLSVAYRETTTQKGVTRELVNASFVNVPSNTEAVVLESKSAELSGDTLLSELTVKQFTELLGKQELSQAPEGGASGDGSEPPETDQAKDEAVALAKAKAAAFQITSQTRQYAEQELNNA